MKTLAHKDVVRHIDEVVADKDWNRIFKQELKGDKGEPYWTFNMEGLFKDMSKVRSYVGGWEQRYGLWPGRTFAQFAAYSRWVHLSTNTLPFYNVYPRLQGKFPSSEFNLFGNDESPANHWLHLHSDDNEKYHLASRMARWLKTKDGVHVLLAGRSEVGWKHLPDRGSDPNRAYGETVPEHVHHNYLYTDEYEKSRETRGVEGASSGQFRAGDVFDS